LNYSYNGHLPEVKQQVVEMALNGSGIRDTARVLKISPYTVIETLKKSARPKGSQCGSTLRA
jgi:transposase-like protein